MTKIQWNDYRWNQKYITLAAFADMPETKKDYSGDYKPTFTITEDHKEGLYSMEKLFLEYYRDPTEYQFVQNVFDGDIKHWETMKNSSVLSKYYTKWKQKAEARLLSEAMGRIVTTALDEDNKNSFQALKYLVERNTVKAAKKSVGRPKKEIEDDGVDTKSLLEDIKRIQG